MQPDSSTSPHKIPNTCPQCGKIFARYKQQLLAKGLPCCSRECSYKYRSRTPEERFWHFVDRSGGPDACWLWTGARDDPVSGYGRFAVSHNPTVQVPAHRFSWNLSHPGKPVPADLFVCHSCDTRYAPGDATYRRCCNPAHLWLGTQSANIQDMVAKGRGGTRVHPERIARGSRHGAYTHPELVRRGEQTSFAKLNWVKVATIRAEYAAGNISQLDLARRNGVSRPTIGAIVHDRKWRNPPTT